VNKLPSRQATERIIYKNILIVDGNALFKLGYCGAKNEYNSNGQHIGGLYQFITVLRKLLNENLYHSVYVFWDGKLSGKLRYDIYPDYKGNRNKDYVNGSKPDEPFYLEQQYQVKEYLAELFIKQLSDESVEADDFIAYICNHKEDNERITICSSDSDLCQLINENILMYHCQKKIFITNNNFFEIKGFHLDNVALIKIICGDTTDNIKGIKGLSETKLIETFPILKERKVELEEIIELAKEIQIKRINEKKTPLKFIDNIINKVTIGVQGFKIYEINKLLVDLSNPLLTEEAKENVENLKDGYFNLEDYGGTKSVYEKMKRDGIDKKVGEERIAEYLMPFKKLIEREKNNNIINK
jgi:DNA polymerase-1